jgi:hypothetical protein
MGVTGAFLGQAAALIVLFLALLIPLLPTLRTPATGLVGRATRLRDLFGRAWVPILGFTLIAALQNIDIVWVKREIGGDEEEKAAAFIEAGQCSHGRQGAIIEVAEIGVVLDARLNEVWCFD